MNTLSLVHDALMRFVQPGFVCVDATAGNGRDTVFLCGLTGKTGRVLAFDIQEEAISRSRQRIAEEGWTDVAEVFCDSHANMGRYATKSTGILVLFTSMLV